MALSGHRPIKAELRAAVGRRLPDVIGHNLKVLFCGINPGLYSAAVGHHFARPGNRFWAALQAAGFTRRVLRPSENRQLLDRGYGLTDLVARATAKAEELTPSELIAGRRRLQRKVHKYTPRWVAVLGIGAFRIAFRSPDAKSGPQPERIAGARIWVLPNPSGLNAGHSRAALADAFQMLRRRASRTPAERR